MLGMRLSSAERLTLAPSLNLFRSLENLVFKDQYESSQQSTNTTDQYRRLVEEETAISRQRHEENLKLAWTSMAGGLGTMLLGCLLLFFGLRIIYALGLIGGGFIGFVSAIGYYQRIK